ncbi:MAG TPA: hypothetical protein VGP36_03665 [Mycobacteriales bacterium]|nr:hypothetical protein [Mycobacteriales bacterium]
MLAPFQLTHADGTVYVAGGGASTVSKLVVSLLPGGPEDPSLGARGSVVSVNPRNGNATRLATGIAGATDIALGDHGRIFVSQLFAGQSRSSRRGSSRRPCSWRARWG